MVKGDWSNTEEVRVKIPEFKIVWPDITFPPINLYNVTEVAYFYKHNAPALIPYYGGLSGPVRIKRSVHQTMKALHDRRSR